MAHRTAVPPNGEEARILAEGTVETIRQLLLILNEDLRVQSANRAFYETFEVEPIETEGRMIYDLGKRQWDIPRLRELLSEILPQRQTVEEFEVEHAFEDIGEKIMLVSARRLQRAGDRPSLILVAIEDVTERRRSRWLLEHQKELAEKTVDTVREPLLIHTDCYRSGNQATRSSLSTIASTLWIARLSNGLLTRGATRSGSRHDGARAEPRRAWAR